MGFLHSLHSKGRSGKCFSGFFFKHVLASSFVKTRIYTQVNSKIGIWASAKAPCLSDRQLANIDLILPNRRSLKHGAFAQPKSQFLSSLVYKGHYKKIVSGNQVEFLHPLMGFAEMVRIFSCPHPMNANFSCYFGYGCDEICRNSTVSLVPPGNLQTFEDQCFVDFDVVHGKSMLVYSL